MTAATVDYQAKPPREPPNYLGTIAPLIVVAVFAVGFAMYVGWPQWPVRDAGERIAYSALVAAALACGATLIRKCWLRLPVTFVAVAVCVVPALVPMVRPGDWTYTTLVLWTLAICVPVAMLATMSQRLRDRDKSPLPGLVALGMTLAGAALLLSTGSLKLGQAGFALAAGVAAAVVIGFLVKAVGRSHGTITLAFAVLAELFASGNLWSELPIYAAICVFAAPLIAWVVRVPFLARRKTWQRVIIGLLLAAIPATVAVAIEAKKASEASQADDYGYGSSGY